MKRMISSDSWDEIESAFSAGLALRPEEREDLLRAAAPAVAKEVRRLWENWESASGFLTSPAIAFEGIPLLVSGQEVLGRFVVIDRLGVGGMSEVYRARDTVLGRLVALKLMQRDLGRNRERLEYEARAISSLSHPNIRSLYDLCWEKDLPVLVMEHLDGETLGHRLGQGSIQLMDVLRCAVEVLKALEHAHDKGIIHRDVKPGNIFLTDTGAKLLDFGIATSQESPLSLAAEIAGSPGYMSPEQLNGEPLDARSDIYSFGRVLQQITRAPERSTIRDDISKDAEKLSKRKSLRTSRLVRTHIESVARKCVAIEPKERFQTALAVRQALEKIGANATKTKTLNAKLLAIVTAITVSILALMWWSWREPRAKSAARFSVPVRLTIEGGRAQEPVISPDGKRVAFASDRSGNFDIYVKEIESGQVRQLTSSPFDERQPSFTPDGSHVVFQSSERGAGISAVPSGGGPIRHIVGRGYRPRVSPDGTKITYWIGVGDFAVNGASTIHIVPFEGGQPTTLAPNFWAAGFPIWSDDGKYVIFFGEDMSGRTYDWWFVRTDGSKTGRIPAQLALDEIGKPNFIMRPVFYYRGNVYGTARVGLTSHVVAVSFQPDQAGKRVVANSVMQSISGIEAYSVSRNGLVAFTSSTTNDDLYRLRLNPITHRASSDLERLTSEDSNENNGSTSEDGRLLCYQSDRDGSAGVWLRDLVTGVDRKIGSLPPSRYYISEISPDGRLIAFGRTPASTLIASSNGKTLLELPGMWPYQWKNNEQLVILLESAITHEVSNRPLRVLNITTHSLSLLNRSDNRTCRWMNGGALDVCSEAEQNGSLRISVVKPMPGAHPHFITFADHEPDIFSTSKGDVCYWYGRRNNHDCLLGIRLNTHTAEPIGRVFVAYEFKSNEKIAASEKNTPVLRNNSVIVPLTETKSNIWLQRFPN